MYFLSRPQIRTQEVTLTQLEYANSKSIWIAEDSFEPEILNCIALLFAKNGFLAKYKFLYKIILPNYSTVTDFAKLRGWSTSVPLISAT